MSKAETRYGGSGREASPDEANKGGQVIKLEIDWADKAETAEPLATDKVAVEVLQMQGENGWPLVQLTGEHDDVAEWLGQHWAGDEVSVTETMEWAQPAS